MTHCNQRIREALRRINHSPDQPRKSSMNALQTRMECKRQVLELYKVITSDEKNRIKQFRRLGKRLKRKVARL